MRPDSEKEIVLTYIGYDGAICQQRTCLTNEIAEGRKALL